MIKLKDLLIEAAQLSKYQIFAPGTGGKEHGQFKFNPNKVPTGRLDVYSIYDVGGQCFNKPYGVSLVIEIASSSVSKGMIDKTGPKISVLAISI